MVVTQTIATNHTSYASSRNFHSNEGRKRHASPVRNYHHDYHCARYDGRQYHRQSTMYISPNEIEMIKQIRRGHMRFKREVTGSSFQFALFN